MRLGRLTCFLLPLAVSTGLRAAAGLQVYADTLLNGFQDRVWLSHNLSNSATAHSGAV